MCENDLRLLLKKNILVTVALVIFFWQILCTQFLVNGSVHFYETIRSERYRSEPYRNFFPLMTSLLVLRYWCFSVFQRVGLSSDLLLDHWRYWFQIFRDDFQIIVDVPKGIRFFLMHKAKNKKNEMQKAQ